MPREEASTFQFIWCLNLEAGRFQFLGENLLSAGSSGRKLALDPCVLLITCSKIQRKTHLIAQVRHFERQTFRNVQTVQEASIILNASESLRISLDKTCAELYTKY